MGYKKIFANTWLKVLSNFVKNIKTCDSSNLFQRCGLKSVSSTRVYFEMEWLGLEPRAPEEEALSTPPRPTGPKSISLNSKFSELGS